MLKKTTFPLLLFLTVFSVNGWATDSLRFCYFNWPPYSYLDGGTHRGIVIETVDEAMATMGKTVIWHKQPYRRCVYEVSKGNYDGTPVFVPRPGVDLPRVNTSMVYHLAVFVVGKNSKHQSFEQLQQFAGETMAVLRGGSSQFWLSKQPDINLYLMNDRDDLWPMIRGSRVDVSIDDYLSLLVEGQLDDADKLRVLKPAARVVPTYIGFSPQRSHLATVMDQRLQELMKDRRVLQFYRRYLGQTAEELAHSLGLESLEPKGLDY